MPVPKCRRFNTKRTKINIPLTAMVNFVVYPIKDQSRNLAFHTHQKQCPLPESARAEFEPTAHLLDSFWFLSFGVLPWYSSSFTFGHLPVATPIIPGCARPINSITISCKRTHTTNGVS